MKAFRAIAFFSAVMLSPPIIAWGIVVDSFLTIVLAAVVGGISLYMGITELAKVSQIDKVEE